MTDQLPAVFQSGAVAPAAAVDTYIVVPALVAASGGDAAERFRNFFATQIENDNTRAAYLRAAREFLAWCDSQRSAGPATLLRTAAGLPRPGAMAPRQVDPWLEKDEQSGRRRRSGVIAAK